MLPAAMMPAYKSSTADEEITAAEEVIRKLGGKLERGISLSAPLTGKERGSWWCGKCRCDMMRTIRILILLTIAALCPALLAADSIPSDSLPLHRVRWEISSMPSNAAVSIDTKPIGTTPLAVDSLPAAAYYLMLDAPGYHLWRDTVRLLPGKDTVRTLIRLSPRYFAKQRIALYSGLCAVACAGVAALADWRVESAYQQYQDAIASGGARDSRVVTQRWQRVRDASLYCGFISVSTSILFSYLHVRELRGAEVRASLSDGRASVILAGRF